MKKTVLVSAMLAAALVTGGALAREEAVSPDSVSGKTYLLLVKSSFGTRFTDCFAFNNDGGFFSTEGLWGTWSEVSIGPFTRWSVDATTGGTDLEFKGIQLSRLIAGNGQNTEGDTFDLIGFESDCLTPSAIPGGDPYTAGKTVAPARRR